MSEMITFMRGGQLINLGGGGGRLFLLKRSEKS